MCNLYNLSAGPAAILERTGALTNAAGNVPGGDIYPNYGAPIVRKDGDDRRELIIARWGMPSPAFALKGRSVDRGITNVRNTSSPHWRRWLGPTNRCLVPANAFAEPGRQIDPETGRIRNQWFALSEDRPLFVFAGVWTRWTGVRKLKHGEITVDLFAFLTTEPNSIVEPIHPKAMPVILTERDEIEIWLNAPWGEASALQRPLPDDLLVEIDAPAKRSH